MNRATELEIFLSKLEKKVENEKYLRKIYELPSYVFIIVCNALMDRKISLEIMNDFLYNVETECITEKEEVNYDEFIKRLQLDYDPEEEFKAFYNTKKELISLKTKQEKVLACIIKKMFDDKKYVNIDGYVKELKNITEELNREYKIHSKFEEMNIDNLIRSLNLETKLSTKHLQFYRNKLMLKAKEIRNLESIKERTTGEIELRSINTRLNKLKKEFNSILDFVKSVEGKV